MCEEGRHNRIPARGNARRRCGSVYREDGAVLDFLPDDLRDPFHVEHGCAISTHHYDYVALGIVEEVRRRDGNGARLRLRHAADCR